MRAISPTGRMAPVFQETRKRYKPGAPADQPAELLDYGFIVVVQVHMGDAYDQPKAPRCGVDRHQPSGMLVRIGHNLVAGAPLQPPDRNVHAIGSMQGESNLITFGIEDASELAAELDIQPSLIHLWVKQVLDQAEKAFERSKGPKEKKREDRAAQRIAHLEAKGIRNPAVAQAAE